MLLRKMTKSLTAAKELEKKQWEKYFCWCKNVVDQKNEMITNARARLEAIEAEISTSCV